MGFEQFLRYAENMMRVVQFDLRLGVTLGLVSYEEVELFISRCDKLQRRIRHMLEKLELCEHKSVG